MGTQRATAGDGDAGGSGDMRSSIRKSSSLIATPVPGKQLLVPIAASQYVLVMPDGNGLFFPDCLWALETGWCASSTAAEALRIRRVLRVMPKTYEAWADDGQRVRSFSRGDILAATSTAGQLDALVAKLDRISQRHGARMRAVMDRLNARAEALMRRLAAPAEAEIQAALPQRWARWP